MIIEKANILLPKNNINLTKWATIACDQHTSEIEYWNKVNEIVGSDYSTLNLVLPEIFINEKSKFNIEYYMDKYLKENIFKEYQNCFVLTVRSTKNLKNKLGLIACINLENYGKDEERNCLIKSTEGLVEERVLSRIEMREKSSLEVSHTILLYKDLDSILENLYKNREKLELLYDFKLMNNGGEIQGYLINGELATKLQNDFENLYLKLNEKTFFLVGDGNHSLATAKMNWEKIKKNLSNDEIKNHSSKSYLVEIENIFDKNLIFYPIHRILFNVDDLDYVVKYFQQHLQGESKCNMIIGKNKYSINVNSNIPIAIYEIENCIKDLLQENKKIRVDYIHNDNIFYEILCKNTNALGIEMPNVDKNEFFDYVIKYGNLCKKSFSIGEADDKKFYIECRKIN